MKSFCLPLCLLLAASLVACTPPGNLRPPGSDTVEMRRLGPQEVAQLPSAPTRIHPGDTLRILRDAQYAQVLDIRNLVDDSQASLYLVRQDGSFSFRFAGRIEAQGRTPDDVAADLTAKLTPYYVEPAVTINIVSSPSSKVVIGGAVRTPAAIDLNAVSTLEQALFAAGGLLPTADLSTVALLRLDEQARYQVHFIDFRALLQPVQGGRPTLAFQRGDIVFVPQSAIGNAGDGVNAYIRQLLPFTTALGVSFDVN